MEVLEKVEVDLKKYFKKELVLDTDNSKIPEEVRKDVVRRLWPNKKAGNGHTLQFSFTPLEKLPSTSIELDLNRTNYPRICQFLENLGVSKCSIRHSWKSKL